MHNTHNRVVSSLSIMGFACGALFAPPGAHAEPQAEGQGAGVGVHSDRQNADIGEATKLASAENVSRAASDTRVDEAERRPPNRLLLVSSSALFGAAYVPTLITAMANSGTTSGTLFIPVIGPWIEIGQDTSPGNRALLLFSGVAQDLGALGVLTSFLIPDARSDKWPLLGKNRFSVSPIAARGTYHLSARGQF